MAKSEVVQKFFEVDGETIYMPDGPKGDAFAVSSQEREQIEAQQKALTRNFLIWLIVPDVILVAGIVIIWLELVTLPFDHFVATVILVVVCVAPLPFAIFRMMRGNKDIRANLRPTDKQPA